MEKASKKLLAQSQQREHKTTDQWVELERKMRCWDSFWAPELGETIIGLVNDISFFFSRLCHACKP
jgi:hypothetical protein